MKIKNLIEPTKKDNVISNLLNKCIEDYSIPNEYNIIQRVVNNPLGYSEIDFNDIINAFRVRYVDVKITISLHNKESTYIFTNVKKLGLFLDYITGYLDDEYPVINIVKLMDLTPIMELKKLVALSEEHNATPFKHIEIRVKGL